MAKNQEQCDTCISPNENDCASCQKKHIARADVLHDELRIDGYRSLQERRLDQEEEEHAMYPYGRPE